MITIKIKIETLEPFIHIIIDKKNKSSKHYVIGIFSPFRKLIRKIYNNKLRKRFNRLDYKVIKCQGCGEGYAEWKIKNPNMINNDDWYVCSHCVGFFDKRNSKERLETIWELEAQLRVGV